MKVLILSTGTGEGHNSAAKAMKEQFENGAFPVNWRMYWILLRTRPALTDAGSTSGARSGRKGVRQSVPGRQGNFVCQIKVTGVFCQRFVCG